MWYRLWAAQDFGQWNTDLFAIESFTLELVSAVGRAFQMYSVQMALFHA